MIISIAQQSEFQSLRAAQSQIRCSTVRKNNTRATVFVYDHIFCLADTFRLVALQDGNEDSVPFTYDNVLWHVDQDIKFKNPKQKDGQDLCAAFAVCACNAFYQILHSISTHLRAQCRHEIGVSVRRGHKLLVAKRQAQRPSIQPHDYHNKH